MGKRSLFFTIGVCCLLFSCSTNKTQNITGKKIVAVTPVTVNWVGHWQNEGYKETLLYDIARQFEFENQDIILNLKFPNEILQNKEENQFIAEQILMPVSDWDILRINNEVSGPATILKDNDWTKKYLVDFSEYEVFRNNSIPELISEEKKKRWGGIVPGHALDGHNFVLWCNIEVAAKIGIDPKLFEMTTTDFENYLKALHTYNVKNNTNIKAFNLNAGWNPTYALGSQLFASLIGDYGKLTDESYSVEKADAWEQVLVYLEKLSTYDPVDTEWLKRTGPDYNEILKGDCLFMINGTWMYNIWQNLDSTNYKKIIPLELPGFKPNQTYLGEISIPWVVPKNARNREQAIQFMLFWCRPDIADNWVRNTKSPTGIKGSLVQTEFGFDVYETFDYTISKKYSGKKTSFQYNNHAVLFGKKNAGVPVYFAEVLSGTISAREAMRDIRNRIIKN
jgi:ABC-type glycerol-3-phosphate transport system substrate-binding protein